MSWFKSPVILLAFFYFGFIPVGFAQGVGQRQIKNLVLIDAITGKKLSVLESGQVINLATLPSKKLNILAEVSSGVNGVVFDMNTVMGYRIETAPPFAMAGNTGNKFRPWTPRVGQLTVTATPMVPDGGTTATPLTINLTVIDQEQKYIPQSKKADPISQPTPQPIAQKKTAVFSIFLTEEALPVGECSYRQDGAAVIIECQHYLKQISSIRVLNKQAQAFPCTLTTTDKILAARCDGVGVFLASRSVEDAATVEFISSLDATVVARGAF